MEKHVFKFGTGSLAIIIPKKWADKNGIDDKKSLELNENQNGELVLSTKAVGPMEVERTISAGMKGSLVGRWIGMHYLYGFSKIRLYSKNGFTQDQLDGVEERIIDCPGFEITSESNNDIIIEDFTDIKDVDIEKVVNRLRSLINQEFAECLGENHKTVMKIEKLVNRFYMLGVRYVNITQAQDALKYLEALQQLEYISDRLAIVSSSLHSRGKEIISDLNRQFGLCIEGFHGNVGAIQQVAEIRVGVKGKVKGFKGDSLEKYLLSQLSNSISSIAEFGLREKVDED
jgi:phosphate uptake regulator